MNLGSVLSSFFWIMLSLYLEKWIADSADPGPREEHVGEAGVHMHEDVHAGKNMAVLSYSSIMRLINEQKTKLNV